MVTEDDAADEQPVADLEAVKALLAQKFQGLDDPKGSRDTSVKHRLR